MLSTLNCTGFVYKGVDHVQSTSSDFEASTSGSVQSTSSDFEDNSDEESEDYEDTHDVIWLWHDSYDKDTL